MKFLSFFKKKPLKGDARRSMLDYMDEFNRLWVEGRKVAAAEMRATGSDDVDKTKRLIIKYIFDRMYAKYNFEPEEFARLEELYIHAGQYRDKR